MINQTQTSGRFELRRVKVGCPRCSTPMEVFIESVPSPPAPALDVERLAAAMPDLMDQKTCDEVMGPGHDPLDVPYEWYDTPRNIAAAILTRLTEAAEADHEHDWFNPANEVVADNGARVCRICGRLTEAAEPTDG